MKLLFLLSWTPFVVIHALLEVNAFRVNSDRPKAWVKRLLTLRNRRLLGRYFEIHADPYHLMTWGRYGFLAIAVIALWNINFWWAIFWIPFTMGVAYPWLYHRGLMAVKDSWIPFKWVTAEMPRDAKQFTPGCTVNYMDMLFHVHANINGTCLIVNLQYTLITDIDELEFVSKAGAITTNLDRQPVIRLEDNFVRLHGIENGKKFDHIKISKMSEHIPTRSIIIGKYPKLDIVAVDVESFTYLQEEMRK